MTDQSTLMTEKEEDEDEMAQRKKRIEDAEVDILGLDEVSDDSDVEKGKEVHDPDILIHVDLHFSFSIRNSFPRLFL